MNQVMRRATSPGVEWEFEQVWLPSELSRHAVTRLLTDRAEYGGWELARLRIGPDGARRAVLRRKIIRAVRTA